MKSKFKFISKINKVFNCSVKDNRGVSLVELVIVIAIMAVIAGVSSFSYKMVAVKGATQCAKNLQVSLDKNRTTVMGKKNGRLTVFVGSDGIYMQEEFDYSSDTVTTNQNSATKIGKNGVTITYGSGATELTGSMTFEFSRTGALIQGSDYLPIVISKAGRSYSITIDDLTGKVTCTKL